MIEMVSLIKALWDRLVLLISYPDRMMESRFEPANPTPALSDEFQAAMQRLAQAANAGKISMLALHQEVELYQPPEPAYQVGNPHPRWYKGTGKTFRSADIVEPVPAYESMMLDCYEAELPCEVK